MFFDPLYLIFALPALLLSVWASMYTRTTFARYSRVPTSTGVTGAQAAADMLRSHGVRDVRIEQSRGFLSDHYDPAARCLRLSESVYHGSSLAAVGVACHEAGHALQDAQHYPMLWLRTSLVPATSIGSNLSYFVILFGFLLRSQPLILFGAALFSLAVIFSIVTLPVEWNASARAKRAMVEAGIVSQQESRGAGQVLNAAFLTYVAAAVSAIMTLLYYLLRAGVLGGGDE